jgi:YfiR/HmsC-like
MLVTARVRPRATLHRKIPHWLAIICILAAASAYGDSAVSDEMSVKVGFLVNFAKFVEWSTPDSDPLEFCVIGNDRIAARLETSVVGKSIGTRSLTVRNRPDLAQLSSCSVIYIGRTDKKVASQVGQLVAGKSILTVSEFPELGSQGVVINFFLDQERVRFEVHLGVLRLAGLKMSSRLLMLARIAGQ